MKAAGWAGVVENVVVGGAMEQPQQQDAAVELAVRVGCGVGGAARAGCAGGSAARVGCGVCSRPQWLGRGNGVFVFLVKGSRDEWRLA